METKSRRLDGVRSTQRSWFIAFVVAAALMGSSGCAATTNDSNAGAADQRSKYEVRMEVRPAVGEVIPVEVWPPEIPQREQDVKVVQTVFQAIPEQGQPVFPLSPETAASRAGGADQLFEASGYSATGMVAADLFIPPLAGLGMGAAAGPFAPAIWLVTVPVGTAMGLAQGTMHAVSSGERLNAISYGRGQLGATVESSGYIFFPKAKYRHIVIRLRLARQNAGHWWVEIRHNWPSEADSERTAR